MSHTKAAWPSSARRVEACGGANVTAAPFRDTAEMILGQQDKTYSAADPLIIWKPLQTVAWNHQCGVGIGFATHCRCWCGPCRCWCSLCQSWRSPCEERITERQNVPERDGSIR